MIRTIDTRRRWLTGAAVLAALALVLQAVLSASPAFASPGTVVAAPTSGTGVENNDYPRIIRLANSADTTKRGNLLVMYSINDTGVRTHSVVKRSTDNGATWSTISTIYSPTPGWGIYFGSMYELPVASGGLAAGTIIAAGNAWDNVNWGFQEVQTFISTDYGVTWSSRGNCVTKSGGPSAISTGLWGRKSSSTRMATSPATSRMSDCGRRATTRSSSWSPRRTAARRGAAPWTRSRSATPVRGQGCPWFASWGTAYALAYELCRDSVGNADQTCRVYLKTSADGANWGTASSLGTLVQTAGDCSCCTLPAWRGRRAAGPNGTLIAARPARRHRCGRSHHGRPARERRRVVFINTNNGVGAWQAVSAPVTIDPTGDYNNGPGKHCANYSPSMVPTASGNAIMMVTPRFLSGSSTRCDIRFGTGPIGTLPLYAPFDSGNDMGWSTYGGSWSVSGGVYGQSGASSGPKSLVGSTGWTDVTVTTDLRLDSSGQAGVLLRTTSPSVGADNHNGYYVGIETNNTLFIGKQAYNWTGLTSQAVTVTTGVWYHLQVTVVGCTITAVLKRDDSATTTTASATDAGCFAAGQAERSFAPDLGVVPQLLGDRGRSIHRSHLQRQLGIRRSGGVVDVRRHLVDGGGQRDATADRNGNQRAEADRRRHRVTPTRSRRT